MNLLTLAAGIAGTAPIYPVKVYRGGFSVAPRIGAKAKRRKARKVGLKAKKINRHK